MARRLELCLLLCMVLGAIPAGAMAAPTGQGAVVSSFQQGDADGDGRPDVATIIAQYEGRPYRILVYDQDHNMQRSGTWEQGTDFVDDVWVFEVGGAPKLIIRFERTNDGYTAQLFDDVDKDRTVAYVVDGHVGIRVTESAFPTLRVVAKEPWALPGGRVNQLLRITAYRPTDPGQNLAAILPSDGRPAYDREIVDGDDDGIADYDLTRYYPDVPSDWSIVRSGLSVNVGRDALPDFENYLFWPYLGSIRRTPWNAAQVFRQAGESFAPLLVDWQVGQIKAVADFVPRLLGPRQMYNSTTAIKKGITNVVGFERFAHYPFTDNPYPDMIIRWSLAQAGFQEYSLIGERKQYPVQVDISWHGADRVGSLEWDYKLGLAGIHEPPSTVIQYGDFALRDVPYADWPRWFTSQEWAFATFVATEGQPYASNEAIYEWNTVEGATTDIRRPATDDFTLGASVSQRLYLLGASALSPARYYTYIREPFRGEYADLLNHPARLYFSPVDKKLHLFGARQGIWNLGDGKAIRYGSLSGSHIDTWTYHLGEETVKSLYVLPSYLILADEVGVHFIRASILPEVFSALPPADQAAWAALDAQLSANAPRFAPDDFAAMFRQFGLTESTLLNSRVRSLRLTRGGFRFVLEIDADYQVTGQDLLGLGSLSTGQYAVENAGGAFSVSPLTAAQIRLSMRKFAGSGADDLEQIVIDNAGLTDAAGSMLVVEAPGRGGVLELLRVPVDAWAGQRTHVLLAVPATVAERTALRIYLEDSAGAMLAETSAMYEGRQAASSLSPTQALALSSDSRNWAPWLLALAVLAVTPLVALRTRKHVMTNEDGR